MINAAIVGLGWWGQNLVNAVQGKSTALRFIHGVSKDPEGARDFANHHGFALSTDLSDVLANAAVQAVVLATPHSLHPEQVEIAARAGKAVFCEKPFALNRAGAVRAVEACKQARVVLGVGFNKRFWPALVELKRLVDAEVLGELLHIEGNYSNQNSGRRFASWRYSEAESPAGGLTGTGLHILDAFISLLGPVQRVTAQLVVRQREPVPLDTVTAVLQFANGASGALNVIRETPSFWRVHVFGAEASAEMRSETELVIHRSDSAPQRLTFAAVDSLRLELEAFAAAVTGQACYSIPLAEMVDTVAAFEGVVRSIETGAAIDVEPYQE